MKRTASAVARNVDRDRAEREARAKVAEVFGDDPHVIEMVDSSWSSLSGTGQWSVRVSATRPAPVARAGRAKKEKS